MLRMRTGALAQASLGVVEPRRSRRRARGRSAIRPTPARAASAPTSATATTYIPPYAAIVVDAKTGTMLHAAQCRRAPPSGVADQDHDALPAVRAAEPASSRSTASWRSPRTPPIRRRPSSALRRRPDDQRRGRDQGLVTKSANDAAVVVAENLAGSEDEFARQMTRKARALGMSKTIYRNASGLPDDEQVTTARDQALLGLAIQERFPRYYRYFATRSFTYRGQRDPQPQPPARPGRRRRRHQDRLHPRLRLQSRDLGAPRRPPHRRGRAGRPSAGARDARMRELIAQHVDSASTEAHRADDRRGAGAPSRTARGQARAETTATDRFEMRERRQHAGARGSAGRPRRARPRPAVDRADPPGRGPTVSVKPGRAAKAAIGRTPIASGPRR